MTADRFRFVTTWFAGTFTSLLLIVATSSLAHAL